MGVPTRSPKKFPLTMNVPDIQLNMEREWENLMLRLLRATVKMSLLSMELGRKKTKSELVLSSHIKLRKLWPQC